MYNKIRIVTGNIGIATFKNLILYIQELNIRIINMRLL